MEIGRPARLEAGLGVDAELVIEGDQQVLRRDGAILGDLALGVRRADDRPAGEAAAGHQHAHDLAPVVAAGHRVGAGHAVVFIRGVRPNSPITITTVESSKPALVEVFDQTCRRRCRGAAGRASCPFRGSSGSPSRRR